MSDDVDIDEFFTASKVRRMKCGVARVLDHLDNDGTTLSTERAAKLRVALDNPDVTGAAIETVLTDWGVHLKQSTVQRHRTRHIGGGCSCD